MNYKKVMDNMSLREKIGQTAMPVLGALESAGGSQILKNFPIGGVYLQPNENLSTSVKCASWIRKCNNELKIPMSVSTYAAFEKGPGTMFSDLDFFPSIIGIGAANSEEIAYDYGYFQGVQYLAAGVNWSCSPVLDLDNRLSNVGMCRCISDNPELSEILIPKIIKGMHDAGLGSCAKHFPGTTDYRDPHIANSVNSKTLDEWMASDGKIYKSAINAGLKITMSSHCAFPAVDDAKINGAFVPTTMSKKIIDGILRDKLGFEGVVITDAINMRALTSSYTKAEIYIKAFNSGNDIILFTDMDYFDVMEQAILNNEVTMERLNQAVERILRFKESLGLLEKGYIVGKIISNDIKANCKESLKIMNERCLTLVCDKNGNLPLNTVNIKSAAIISISHYEDLPKELETLVYSLKRRGVDSIIYDGLIQTEYIEEIKGETSLIEEIADKFDVIIYVAYIAPHRPIGSPFFSGDVAKTLWQTLEFGKEKSIVVSFGSPHLHYEYFESAQTYINAYTLTEGMQESFVSAIFGEVEFKGISPIKLIPNIN